MPARDHGTVREIVDRPEMQTLAASLKALRMEHAVHIRGARPRAQALRLLPDRGETLGIRAAALEARAVTGRQRSHFVKKEQLGVGTPPHVALPLVERKGAANPLPRRPVAARQRSIIAVETATPIAHEQPAGVVCEKFAERIDAPARFMGFFVNMLATLYARALAPSSLPSVFVDLL
jgi:hypothetical protein